MCFSACLHRCLLTFNPCVVAGERGRGSPWDRQNGNGLFPGRSSSPSVLGFLSRPRHRMVSFTDMLPIFILSWENKNWRAPPLSSARWRRPDAGGQFGIHAESLPRAEDWYQISQFMICIHYVYVYINIFVCLYSIYSPGWHTETCAWF